MKRITALQPPVLAGVIKEKTAAMAIASIKNCKCKGAGMIDLHISCLENTDEGTLKSIIRSTTLPVLALNYNHDLNGRNKGYTEEEREELFIRAIEAGAAGIDMQGYTFDEKSKNGFFGEDIYSFTKNNPKEVVTDEKVIARQCQFIEKVHGLGAEVLLSCHPYIAMKADAVVELALFLQKRNPDIIKIVTYAETEEDLIESFRAMTLLKKEVRTPVSYHTYGQAGVLSRIVNPVLGGFMAFCSDGYKEGSLIEQIDLGLAKQVLDGLNKIL